MLGTQTKPLSVVSIHISFDLLQKLQHKTEKETLDSRRYQKTDQDEGRCAVANTLNMEPFLNKHHCEEKETGHDESDASSIEIADVLARA